MPVWLYLITPSEGRGADTEPLFDVPQELLPINFVAGSFSLVLAFTPAVYFNKREQGPVVVRIREGHL